MKRRVKKRERSSIEHWLPLCAGVGAVWRRGTCLEKASSWDDFIAFLLRMCQFRSYIKVRGLIPKALR